MKVIDPIATVPVYGLLLHCVHEKNYNPGQCKIEMSNLNTS